MKLNDFINKTVVLELKDATIVKGILVEIKEDIIEDEEEIRLVLRIDSEEYRIFDVNEILTIGELI